MNQVSTTYEGGNLWAWFGHLLNRPERELAMTQQIERMEFSGGAGKGHLDKLGDLWCVWMHTSPMWPIHGHYECGVCGRQYPVPWDSGSAQVSH